MNWNLNRIQYVIMKIMLEQGATDHMHSMSCYEIRDIEGRVKADTIYKHIRMVWKAAHDELKALADEEDKKSMEDAKRLDELLQNATMLIPKDEDKPILKKFYRVLANTYHPDNKETGDTNMMKYVNNLKVLWGLS